MSTTTLAFCIFLCLNLIYMFLYIMKIGKLNGLAFLPYDILLCSCSLLNTLFISPCDLLLTGYILWEILDISVFQLSFSLIFIHLFSRILTVLSVSCYIKGYLITTSLIYTTISGLPYTFMLKLIVVLGNLSITKDIAGCSCSNKPFTNRKSSGDVW